MMDYRTLGKRVRQQRMMCGLTQEELAEKSGISCSFVGHIERGEKKFSIGTLVALCNAMKISPNYLLQDSLDQQVLNDSVDVGQKNKALFDDMMNLLREHHIREENY
jgi:transcriptional regulator with XRE-family HTH domain